MIPVVVLSNKYLTIMKINAVKLFMFYLLRKHFLLKCAKIQIYIKKFDLTKINLKLEIIVKFILLRYPKATKNRFP